MVLWFEPEITLKAVSLQLPFDLEKSLLILVGPFGGSV
jgi:hypothetical protein